MKIYIENYEALEQVSLTIEPGITQITGKTNSGKSSIMRALQDFCKNSAGKDEITKDMSEMTINVDGNVFKRNNTRKEYIINGISYGKPGKGPFPELSQLRLGDVNFQNQQSALFLIGDTPGAKYNYIISGRDDEYLTALSDMRKDYKEFNTKHKLLVEQLGSQEQKLAAVTDQLSSFDFTKAKELENLITDRYTEQRQLKELEVKIAKVNLLKEALETFSKKILSNEMFEKINYLIKLLEIKDKQEKIQSIKNEISCIKTVDKELFEKTNLLLKKLEIKKIEKNISSKEIIISAIKTVPESSIEAMRALFKKIAIKNRSEKINALIDKTTCLGTIIECVDIRLNLAPEYVEKLKSLSRMEMSIKNIGKINENLEQILTAIKKSEQQEAQLKEELGVCPLCGNSFKHEH